MRLFLALLCAGCVLYSAIRATACFTQGDAAQGWFSVGIALLGVVAVVVNLLLRHRERY